jgi:hypothetical protein
MTGNGTVSMFGFSVATASRQWLISEIKIDDCIHVLAEFLSTKLSAFSWLELHMLVYQPDKVSQIQIIDNLLQVQ